MSKSQDYNLQFIVTDIKGWGKTPTISTELDSNGGTINADLATFIREMGSRLCQEIIDEINALTEPYIGFFPNEGYRINGNNEEELELFSSPARVVFNSGSQDLIIPLQDFLDILKEWIHFLNGLNFEHSLSNK